MSRFTHTWDGLPVSAERPIAVAVAVWRARADGREWLLLHRAHHGTDWEGDWAWTPPAGARLPGEPVELAARRELAEETGLALELLPTRCGSAEVAVFAAEAPARAEVRLDDEHDRYRWTPMAEVRERCLPALVGEQLACVDAWLERRAPAEATPA